MAVRQILPGYFEALEWPLRLGRLPGRSSTADSQLVAVVNESAARTLFTDGAIGQQLRLGKRTLTVVGVVADVRHGGPLESPRAEMFVPFDASDAPLVRTLGMTLVVRLHGRPAHIAGALRLAVEGVGPPVIVEDIQPAATWLDDRIATPRHRTVLMSMMGGLGFALAVIGVFGLTAYAVSRRTREIGVRIALGANPWKLVQVMTLEAARPAAIGLGIGLLGAYYGTRVLRSFLFETAPTDPATFIAAASLLMSAAVIAAWLPARRAARIDPMTALRAE